MGLTAKEKPDTVIMDIRLPGSDGLEAVKRTRELEAQSETPIIALISCVLAGDRGKALHTGCTAYLEKSLNPENFINEVEKYL